MMLVTYTYVYVFVTISLYCHSETLREGKIRHLGKAYFHISFGEIYNMICKPVFST
jgi:hypothetical protein